jgi:hypothetical protein
MVELDLVTLDREKIVRVLSAAGVDPRIIAIIEELHDTTRGTQKLLEELMDEHKKVIQALQLLNVGYKGQLERMQKLEKKYGVSNVTDILKAERHDG